MKKVKVFLMKLKSLGIDDCMRAHELLEENDYELMRYFCRLPIVGEEAQEMASYVNMFVTGAKFERFLSLLFQEKIAITCK